MNAEDEKNSPTIFETCAFHRGGASSFWQNARARRRTTRAPGEPFGVVALSFASRNSGLARIVLIPFPSSATITSEAGNKECPLMSQVELKVNGRSHTVDIEPATPLLYILRNDLGLQGPKFGCGLGQCGACTVIVNGAAVRSCITPTSSVRGEVITLEGLASNGKLHPLQQAWIDEQVPQCGFCQNGQILTAKVMLDKNPHPTDAEIRESMNATLCRCMSYARVQTAIKRAAKVMA